MKKLITFSLSALMAATVSIQAQTATTGQTSTSNTAAAAPATADTGLTSNYALGDVTAVEAAANQLKIKTKAGDVTVALAPQTKYLRVPPGDKTLEHAEPITLTDIGIGDRVMARGKVSADQKTVPARQVIVMSKAALASKSEHDRAEWQRRGLAGRVTAVNPSTKEITITARTREGQQSIVIAASDNTMFRRYAPDSVKFSDAKLSSLNQIKVGDQVRALGERSSDGTRFTPEEVVSGSFRMVGGTITAVDPATNTLKITNLQTNQPLTIVINSDSVLRRVPAEMAALVAQRRAAGGGFGNRPNNPDNAASGGAPGGAARGEGGGMRPGGAAAGAGMNGSGERPRFGSGGSGGDMQEMLERLPVITIGDLKPGDMILVSSTTGADPTRLTAITLASGVEPLLRAPSAAPNASGGGRRAAQGNNSDFLGLEGLGGGIGLP